MISSAGANVVSAAVFVAAGASVDWASSLLISLTVSVFNDFIAVNLVFCPTGFVVVDDSCSLSFDVTLVVCTSVVAFSSVPAFAAVDPAVGVFASTVGSSSSITVVISFTSLVVFISSVVMVFVVDSSTAVIVVVFSSFVVSVSASLAFAVVVLVARGG